MRAIDKRFGAVRANAAVDLTVATGSVAALKAQSGLSDFEEAFVHLAFSDDERLRGKVA